MSHQEGPASPSLFVSRSPSQAKGLEYVKPGVRDNLNDLEASNNSIGNKLTSIKRGEGVEPTVKGISEHSKGELNESNRRSDDNRSIVQSPAAPKPGPSKKSGNSQRGREASPIIRSQGSSARHCSVSKHTKRDSSQLSITPSTNKRKRQDTSSDDPNLTSESDSDPVLLRRPVKRDKGLPIMGRESIASQIRSLPRAAKAIIKPGTYVESAIMENKVSPEGTATDTKGVHHSERERMTPQGNIGEKSALEDKIYTRDKQEIEHRSRAIKEEQMDSEESENGEHAKAAEEYNVEDISDTEEDERTFFPKQQGCGCLDDDNFIREIWKTKFISTKLMRFDRIIKLVGEGRTKSVTYHIHGCRLALHSELYSFVYGPGVDHETDLTQKLQIEEPEILADFQQWIYSNEHLPLQLDEANLPARCFKLWDLGIKLQAPGFQNAVFELFRKWCQRNKASWPSTSMVRRIYKQFKPGTALRKFAAYSVAYNHPLVAYRNGLAEYAKWHKLLQNCPELNNDVTLVSSLVRDIGSPWDDRNRRHYLVQEKPVEDRWQELILQKQSREEVERSAADGSGMRKLELQFLDSNDPLRKYRVGFKGGL